MLDKPDTAVRTMRRRLRDADVYLFFNEGPQTSEHHAILRSEGKRLEMWDAQTGKTLPTVARETKGAVTVQLNLKPYETSILIVR